MPSRRPPSQRDPQYLGARLAAAVQQMAPGSRGGQVRSAAPVRPALPNRRVPTQVVGVGLGGQFVGLSITPQSGTLSGRAVLRASTSLEAYHFDDNNSGGTVAGEITLPANTVLAFQPSIPDIGSLAADGNNYGYLRIYRTRDAAGSVVSGPPWSAGAWTWSGAGAFGYFSGPDANTAEYEKDIADTSTGSTLYLGLKVLLAGTYFISAGIYMPF